MANATWSEEDSRWLSARLVLLADQIPEICNELEGMGLATAARLSRQMARTYSVDDAAYAKLHEYWIEYAKERLGSLNRQTNIETRRLPDVCAYRSKAIDELYANWAAGKLKNEGDHVSPQIEPTLKRRLEWPSNEGQAKREWDAIKAELRRAAVDRACPVAMGFEAMTTAERYDLLCARYRQLEEFGFSLDSRRKHGAVFRRLNRDRRLTFIFSDDSTRNLDLGLLSVQFAIAHPRKGVIPSMLPTTCLATIPTNCLVPDFASAQYFSRDSSAEMFLAADSVCALAASVARRVDALLST